MTILQKFTHQSLRVLQLAESIAIGEKIKSDRANSRKITDSKQTCLLDLGSSEAGISRYLKNIDRFAPDLEEIAGGVR